MEKELQGALDDLKKELSGTMDEKAKKAAEEKFVALEKQIKDGADANKVELQKQYDELKGQFDAFNAKAAELLKNGPQKQKSFNEDLRDTLKEAIDLRKKGQATVELTMKTAITSSNFTGDTGGSGGVIAPMREIGINKAPLRKPFLREQAFNGTSTSDTVSWTEQTTRTGNPIPLAELDAYSQESMAYQQFSTGVKKIGGMMKVSEEKLEDVDYMMNEIQMELVQRHDLVVDTQLLSGDGTGQNLKGVLQYAPAFAAGSFAAKVPGANRADALRVAYNQIIVALFQPTFIAMHPTDIAFMELEKDTQNRYILPPFVSANGMTVKGLPVVENTGVAEGTFLIGDGTRMGVFAKGGAVLEIGRDGSDFSTDQLTVKLRERLAFRIKGRDLAAFVQGTFATAIGAINL